MLEQTLDLDALIATVNNLLDAAGDDSSTQKTVLLEYLNELQPFDLANVLSRLEFSKQLAFLSILPVDTAAEVLSHLEFEHQYRLLDHADEQVARAILAQMASDSLVDLLGAIHPLQANEILKRLPPEDLDHIRQMMTYPPESAVV